MKRLLLTAIAALMMLPALPQPKSVYGYLYCHMSRRGEWTAFALSRDGENWHDLNSGNEVYDTKALSRIEGGARDAYINRSADGKGFVMVTTDMCVANSHKWNNYGMDLLKSDDLCRWTSVTFDFRKGPGIFCDPESPDVYKDYSGICRVWAPQVVWDKDYTWKDGTKGGYFIYYSLLKKAEAVISFDLFFSLMPSSFPIRRILLPAPAHPDCIHHFPDGSAQQSAGQNIAGKMDEQIQP